jgi:hypothetical protein
VSNYSNEYWNAWFKGKVNTDIAMHETLAEIAAFRTIHDGDLPGPEDMRWGGDYPKNKSGWTETKAIEPTKKAGNKYWISLYRLVDEEWEAHEAPGHAEDSAMADAFDESKHPRGQPENKGQFVKGGGASKGSEGTAHAKRPKRAEIPGSYSKGLSDEERHERAQRLKGKAEELAEARGFPKERVTVTEDNEQFEIDGAKHYSAGGFEVSHPDTGRLILYADCVDEKTMDQVVAHEVEHYRFALYVKGYQDEMKAARKKYGDLATLNSAYGGFKPPYDKEFPRFHQFAKWLDNLHHPDVPYSGVEMIGHADGVSNYSKEYWQAFFNGKASVYLAFHETLAEIARFEVERGHLPSVMDMKGAGDVPRLPSGKPDGDAVWATLEVGHAKIMELYAMVNAPWQKKVEAEEAEEEEAEAA